MTTREARALGVAVTERVQQESTIEEQVAHANQNLQTMATATTALQVNPFHNVIDLTYAKGNKLCQKATQGLSEE